jgi:hypothetical protein
MQISSTCSISNGDTSLSLTNAPSEADQLRENLLERTAALRKRRDDLLAGVQRVPEVIDDEDAASRLTDFIKQVNAFLKRVEEEEKGLKRPALEQQRGIGAFFTEQFGKMNKAKAMLTAKQTAFLKECQAIEAKMNEPTRVRGDFGSIATLQHRWAFTVEDYAKINYILLGAYLDREAIDKAIRKAVSAGVRDLAGVKIFKEEKAVVR